MTDSYVKIIRAYNNFKRRLMAEENFPPAFEHRMREVLGERWSDFAAAHRQVSPVSIRVNEMKIPSHNYHDAIPWTKSGYYLAERPSFTLDPVFHGGGYYVQEASSMFLEQAFVQIVDADASLNVLDLCSAPGGKSTHLASLINANSLLVSNEVIRSRVSVVAENILKWGKLNTVVTHNDPKDFQRLPGFFDVIIVDAPCSGEGLFRKDPNAMKEWSTEQVGMCSSRQRRILNDIWPALKSGGVLIYSTCTYNEAENEDVLDWLNGSHDVEFVPLVLDETWGIQEIRKNNTYGYRFFPHSVRGEGFFISVMRKLRDEREIRLKPKSIFSTPARKIVDQLHFWMKSPEEKSFIIRNDQIIQCFPRVNAPAIELLSQNLFLISAGATLATLKHDKLIPEHAAALSVELDLGSFNFLDLDLEDSIKYLRKESVDGKDTNRGFALVRYKHLPLGWVNVLDNRVNNMYPSEWRIRMSGKAT